MVSHSVFSTYRFTSDCLFTAVEERDVNRLARLFSLRKAHPNCFNLAGDTLLIAAVAKGFFQGVKTILNQPNINLNLKNRNGEAAIHVAAKKGDLAALRLLAEKGANKNIRDKRGYSPLHYAVKSGSYGIVNYLINDPSRRHHRFGKVDLNLVAYDQSTALFLAGYSSDLDVVKLLIEAGAEIDRRDQEGYTLKALAVFNCWGGQADTDIPMDGYTCEFIKRKVLAHWNGIDCRTQIHKEEFYLWGGYYPYMHRVFRDQFAMFFHYVQLLPPSCVQWRPDALGYAQLKIQDLFFQQTADEYMMNDGVQLPYPFSPIGIFPEQIETIIEAFDWLGSCPSSFQTAERIKSGVLTIIASGWHRHVIDLVFFRNYLAICNRGEGTPDGFHTIEVFVIDPKRLTSSLVDAILAQSDVNCEKASPYFYFDLPIELSPGYPGIAVQDPICRSIAQIAPSVLEAGTCCFTSAKAAARVSLQLLKMFEAHPASYDSIGQACTRILKDVSTLGRILELERYLRFHFSSEPRFQDKSPPDFPLIRKVYSKARIHANGAPQPLRGFFQSCLTRLQDEYREVLPQSPFKSKI